MSLREDVKYIIAECYGLNRSSVENMLEIIEDIYDIKFEENRVRVFNGYRENANKC